MDEGVPSWARAGAKCVCINAVFVRFANNGGLERGKVYTVANVYVDPYRNLVGPYKSGAGVRLAEIENPNSDHGGYSVARFRPLITRSLEADVSRFRKHLRTKRTRTDAFVKIPHLGEVS